MSKEAMKLALEALIAATPVKAKDPQLQANAIVALRDALAEQLVIECDCETATSPDGSRLTKCGSDQMRRAVQEGHAFCKQPAQQEPVAFSELAKRRVFDYIRGAYDLGYSDARNARSIPGDSAPGYKGRDVEADHGGALLHSLQALYTRPQAREPEQPAQADGETIVQTFTGLPRRKLRELLSGGWEVNGVCFQRTEEDGTVRRGAATIGGMVIWWNAEQPAQKRPPNCGTGFCSCIECVMEPKQPAPTKCWKCGDADPAFTDVCQVPACGMREKP